MANEDDIEFTITLPSELSQIHLLIQEAKVLSREPATMLILGQAEKRLDALLPNVREYMDAVRKRRMAARSRPAALRPKPKRRRAY